MARGVPLSSQVPGAEVGGLVLERRRAFGLAPVVEVVVGDVIGRAAAVELAAVAGLDLVVDRLVDHGGTAAQGEPAALGVEQVAEVVGVAVVDVGGQDVGDHVAEHQVLAGGQRHVAHRVVLELHVGRAAVLEQQAAELERAAGGVVDLEPLVGLVGAAGAGGRVVVGEHLGDDEVAGDQAAAAPAVIVVAGTAGAGDQRGRGRQ